MLWVCASALYYVVNIVSVCECTKLSRSYCEYVSALNYENDIVSVCECTKLSR